MTTLRIPRLPGAWATIELVDATTGAPVLGFDDIAWATTYRRLSLDDEQLADLTPTEDIATAGGGATAYRIAIVASGRRSTEYRVQIPDSLETQELIDLVGAATIDPADVLAGRLLPLLSGAQPGDVLVIDQDGVPTWTPLASLLPT